MPMEPGFNLLDRLPPLEPAISWPLLAAAFLSLLAGLLANAALLRNRSALLVALYVLAMGLQLPLLAAPAGLRDLSAHWQSLPLLSALIAAGLYATLVHRSLATPQRKRSRQAMKIFHAAVLLLTCAFLFTNAAAGAVPGVIAACYLFALVLSVWQYIADLRYAAPLALSIFASMLLLFKSLPVFYPGFTNPLPLCLAHTIETFGVAAFALLIAGARARELQQWKMAMLAQRENIAALAPLFNASRHELRAPLTDIVGLATLIGDQPLDKEQRSHLAALLNAARRALQNVNELFSFRQGTANNHAAVGTRSEYFQPEMLIEECCQYYRHELEARNADVVVDLDPALPQSVQGDHSALRQLLLLLLEHFLVERQATGLLLEISSGPDAMLVIRIGSADASSASNTETSASSSMLDNAQNLSEECGANLHQPPSAGPGEPACIELQFPVQLVCIETQAGKGSGILAGQRVLIVEDSSTASKVIQSYLERWQIIARTANNAASGRVALLNAAAVNKPFDIVIVDYRLPDANGLEFVELVLAESTLLPVPAIILVSNSVTSINERSARNHGVHHIIEKPVLAETLKLTLLETLHFRSSLRGDLPKEDLRQGSDVHPGPAYRALLVEDDPVSARVTGAQLDWLGFDLDIAGSAADALARCNARHYDIVILDCNLPDYPGFELAGQLHAAQAQRSASEQQRTRIFTLSADDDPRLADKSEELGLDGHLVKPVSAADLEIISRSLHRQ